MTEIKNHPTEGLITEILKLISSFPDFLPLKEDIASKLDELSRSIRESRPPRIMVMGRAKSGKSSLINAIVERKVAEVNDIEPQTGKAQWKVYYNDKMGSPIIHILDTRGLQEAKKPNEDPDSRYTPTESLLKAVNEHCPDLILFLCEATSVNVAVQEDITVLEKVYEYIDRKYYRKLPLIALVTKCDQLAPFGGWINLENQKRENCTERPVQELRNHLVMKDIWRYKLQNVIPIVSYAEYGEGEYGEIDPGRDYRWNIDKLNEIFFKILPQETQAHFIRASKVKKFQEKLAIGVTDSCAVICASIAFIPIPFAAIPIVAGIHTLMVTYIGYLSGRELSEEIIKDFLKTAGVGAGTNLGLRAIAEQLSILIPGYGSLMNVAAITLATRTIGQAAIEFFILNTSSEEISTKMQSIQIE